MKLNFNPKDVLVHEYGPKTFGGDSIPINHIHKGRDKELIRSLELEMSLGEKHIKVVTKAMAFSCDTPIGECIKEMRKSGNNANIEVMGDADDLLAIDVEDSLAESGLPTKVRRHTSLNNHQEIADCLNMIQSDLRAGLLLFSDDGMVLNLVEEMEKFEIGTPGSFKPDLMTGLLMHYRHFVRLETKHVFGTFPGEIKCPVKDCWLPVHIESTIHSENTHKDFALVIGMKCEDGHSFKVVWRDEKGRMETCVLPISN